jgi:TonB family protein
MIAKERESSTFNKAVTFSMSAHLALFIVVLLSPHVPKPARKEMIHYVSVVSFPGGGSGSGGGEEKIAEAPLPERETLKDLTTPQRFEQEPPSSLRHPVKKPGKEPARKAEKKAVIQKSQKVPQKTKPVLGKEAGSGSGSGIKIGGGGGPGADLGSGAGFRSEYSSQIGLSNFPFTYYLQIILDRISGRWYTSLIDPGIKGDFQATVHFKIHRNGQISDLKIQETSGIRSLDLSAQRAVQNASSSFRSKKLL